MSKLLKNGKEIYGVRDIEYLHGKIEYEISPDFCGTSTKIPGKRLPDKIIFTVPAGWDLAGEYQLRYDEFRLFTIQILDVTDGKVIAVVKECL
jgi:hypothetical protein